MTHIKLLRDKYLTAGESSLEITLKFVLLLGVATVIGLLSPTGARADTLKLVGTPTDATGVITRPYLIPDGISDPGDFYSPNLLRNYPVTALYLPNLIPGLQSMKADRVEDLSYVVREALDAQHAGSFDRDASEFANGALSVPYGPGRYFNHVTDTPNPFRTSPKHRIPSVRVPEPPTAWLLGIGLAIVLLLFYRSNAPHSMG